MPEADAASVADEAAKLAEAFAGWAGRSRSMPADGAADTDPVAAATQHAACDCAHGPGVEAVCRSCPVCRAAGLIQAVSPELLDRAADLLELLAGGLHSAAAGRRTREPDGHDSQGHESHGHDSHDSQDSKQ